MRILTLSDDNSSLSELMVTSEPFATAYKYGRGLKLYWKLKPEERAPLLLSRKLKAVKGLTLREILIKKKEWPTKSSFVQVIRLREKIHLIKRGMSLKISAKGSRVQSLKVKQEPGIRLATNA